MTGVPAIAVIIPTMQRPARLWAALQSVGEQSYPAVEAVVVNDGGAPVEAVVEHYRQQFQRPITYLALGTNGGLANARNQGIALTSAPWIAFLDDDDRFTPDHLARLAAVLAADPSAVLAYEDVLIEVESGTDQALVGQLVATCRFGRPYDRTTFDQDDFIPPSTMVLRRAGWAAAGGFDPVIPMCEDWDFLFRLRDYGRFAYVSGAIGAYYSLRVGGADNLGSTFDERRRRALDMLAARYGVAPLQPKTFLDVARDLGFVITPVIVEA